FLQLCAEDNFRVADCTTPAQYFHLLRRQAKLEDRRPLIVFTPKSLLRNPRATSAFDELAAGTFRPVLADEAVADRRDRVTRLVLCTGKVYYDLLEARRADERDDVAVVRVEQLYPFPDEEYEAQLKRYPNANDVVWCQEEPMNQGAWYQIRHRLQAGLAPRHELRYAGREHAASTAAGYFKLHVAEQKALIEQALNGNSQKKNPAKKTGTEKA
ncbi:MAG: 2-oxoglutarate dehydrogenase E1 component, partial [Proteobacteria bacterium]|nr:2-oxoglutarate dehydrogenase E1 component [Pseudomonadota bacterium]